MGGVRFWRNGLGEVGHKRAIFASSIVVIVMWFVMDYDMIRFDMICCAVV